MRVRRGDRERARDRAAGRCAVARRRPLTRSCSAVHESDVTQPPAASSQSVDSTVSRETTVPTRTRLAWIASESKAPPPLRASTMASAVGDSSVRGVGSLPLSIERTSAAIARGAHAIVISRDPSEPCPHQVSAPEASKVSMSPKPAAGTRARSSARTLEAGTTRALSRSRAAAVSSIPAGAALALASIVCTPFHCKTKRE